LRGFWGLFAPALALRTEGGVFEAVLVAPDVGLGNCGEFPHCLAFVHTAAVLGRAVRVELEAIDHAPARHVAVPLVGCGGEAELRSDDFGAFEPRQNRGSLWSDVPNSIRQIQRVLSNLIGARIPNVLCEVEGSELVHNLVVLEVDEPGVEAEDGVGGRVDVDGDVGAVDECFLVAAAHALGAVVALAPRVASIVGPPNNAMAARYALWKFYLPAEYFGLC